MGAMSTVRKGRRKLLFVAFLCTMLLLVSPAGITFQRVSLEILWMMPWIQKLCTRLLIPEEYQTYGLQVPVEAVDGLKLMREWAPLPHEAQQCHRRSLSDAQLAIAIPFVSSQSSALMEALKRISRYSLSEEDGDISPTNTKNDIKSSEMPSISQSQQSVSSRIDFYLFFHKDEATLEELKILDAAQQVIHDYTGGASTLRVVYSHLTPAQDRYPNGPFYQLIHMFQCLNSAGYEAFFLMEPDTWPVQAGWGQALLSLVQSKEEWWIKGSLWHTWYPAEYHLNGNALYRLQDNAFFVFLFHALQQVRKDPRLGFDMAIQRYKIHLQHAWFLGKDVYHKMSVTSVVVNLSLTKCWSAAQVLTEYPHAYVVHTKAHALETEPTTGLRSSSSPKSANVKPQQHQQRQQKLEESILECDSKFLTGNQQTMYNLFLYDPTVPTAVSNFGVVVVGLILLGYFYYRRIQSMKSARAQR